MPSATCRLTVSATAPPTTRLNSPGSTASPFSRFCSRSTTAPLRGRLPTWVVRMRSRLVFTSASWLTILRPGHAHRTQRLFAQPLPQAGRDGAEALIRHDAAVARAWPAGGHDIDEAAGPRRHDGDPVGQHGGLVERMGDQHHGRAGLAPDAQELVA